MEPSHEKGKIATLLQNDHKGPTALRCSSFTTTSHLLRFISKASVRFHRFQKVFESRPVRTVAFGVAVPISASPPLSFGAAPRISFQCAVRTHVLVVTAPTSVEKALSVHFVRYHTTHVGKVGPAIASSIACFKICLNKVSLNNQSSII